MLRGDSLALSEGPPALVDHGGSMLMIEPGGQHNPEGWAQDVPTAMRTPSLEARQVRDCHLAGLHSYQSDWPGVVCKPRSGSCLIY
jgi:hypothetical protein